MIFGLDFYCVLNINYILKFIFILMWGRLEEKHGNIIWRPTTDIKL